MSNSVVRRTKPNLYANLVPDDVQWARVAGLSSVPRTLAELQRELMCLSTIYDGGNPDIDGHDHADIGSAIDALRLAVIAIPATTGAELWVKQCCLADATPRLAINAHLRLLADASISADRARLDGCELCNRAKKCALN